MHKLIIIKSALVLFTVFLQSCNPIYVMQAAMEEGKILINRNPIAEVIQNQDTPEAIRKKLELIIAAKQFAPKIGLKSANNYDYYSYSEKPALTYVLMASPKTSFSFKTWWFPIVGNVPYKGYFKLSSARKAAEQLESQGYETSIRGADAFSTLGWFNDPVVTPFLKRNEVSLVDTVFHELVHSSYWVKNNVAFNESLANFVGAKAAVEFYEDRINIIPNQEKYLAAAKNNYNQQMQLAKGLEKLFVDLENLYKTKQGLSDKLKRREVIFKYHQQQEPALKVFKQINNAELLQVKIYMQELQNFEKLHGKGNSAWSNFWNEINKISSACSENYQADAFQVLKNSL